MAHEWFACTKSLVLKFEFVAAKRFLLNPLAMVDEPVLVELKALLVSRVHASSILKRLLQ